jgi:hypothetical protein
MAKKSWQEVVTALKKEWMYWTDFMRLPEAFAEMTPIIRWGSVVMISLVLTALFSLEAINGYHGGLIGNTVSSDEVVSRGLKLFLVLFVVLIWLARPRSSGSQ